jgi:hypothetical protein
MTRSSDRPRAANGRLGLVIAGLKRVPVVAVAAVLLFLSLGAWAFASPVGSSPDDDFHLASIWCADGERAYACEPGDTPYSREVPEGVTVGQHCYARDPAKSAACQESLLHAPAVANTLTNRGSFANNYPPVFYAVMGALVTADIAVSVVLMRVLTILLFCGIAVGLFLALPRHRRAPLIWGWALTVVPLGMFLLASNNPSSWAIIGLGSGWISLLGYLETSGRRKVVLAGLLVVSVVMASGARADAAVYSVIAMGATVLLTFRRERRYLIDLILPAVLSVVAFLFFVSSQQSAVVSGGLPSDGSSAGSGPTTAGNGLLSLVAFNLLNLPSLWSGIFGGWGLGWLDTAMPAVVTAGGIIAFLVATAIGVGREWGRKVIVVCLLVLAIWLIPVYVLVQGGQHVGDTVQPRYILPLMIVLAGVALLTQRDRPIPWGRFQIIMIGVALVVSNTVALQTNIRRYVTGTDVAGFDLDAGREWWWHVPFSPMFDWIGGSLAFALLVVLLGRAALREGRRAADPLVTAGTVAR